MTATDDDPESTVNLSTYPYPRGASRDGLNTSTVSFFAARYLRQYSYSLSYVANGTPVGTYADRNPEATFVEFRRFADMNRTEELTFVQRLIVERHRDGGNWTRWRSDWGDATTWLRRQTRIEEGTTTQEDFFEIGKTNPDANWTEAREETVPTVLDDHTYFTFYDANATWEPTEAWVAGDGNAYVRYKLTSLEDAETGERSTAVEGSIVVDEFGYIWSYHLNAPDGFAHYAGSWYVEGGEVTFTLAEAADGVDPVYRSELPWADLAEDS